MAVTAEIRDEELIPIESVPDGCVKVSVVMPIYNAYAYLRPALDSVLSQTLREIELICIDDGSDDHSLEILKEYQSEDRRIRIVTENNAGPSRARNNGLRRARGQYIAFLDADDFYEPTLLERLYTAATERSLDIAIADYDLYISNTSCFRPRIPTEKGNLLVPGAVTGKNDFPDSIFQMVDGYVWDKLFSAAFLRDKGLTFAEDVTVFEDVFFVTVALALAERISFEDSVLVHHRVYSDQTRNQQFKKRFSEIPALYVRIKEELMHVGMYIPLAQSFVNLSASRCYKVYNLLHMESKHDFYTLLHESAAEKLGWGEIAADAYDSPEVREFVTLAQMFPHSQYVGRQERGIHLPMHFIYRFLEKRRAGKNKRQQRGTEEPGFFGTLWRKIVKKKKK